MIGIIQKTLTECLLQAGGEDLRRAVFREAGVPEDRVFRMDQNYPDDELGRLIETTKRLTGLGTDAVDALFAKTFVRLVKQVFPQFMAMSAHSEDLVRLQARIHALIGSGLRSKAERDATTDKFHLEEDGQHRIVVRYRSHLQLCGLYRHLVQAMAEEFGDTVDIATVRCRRRGAETCAFRVGWTSLAGRLTGVDLHQVERPGVQGVA
jgi:hypothetical protein